MKRQWENEELIKNWMFSAWDLAQLGNKIGATRLGFVVLLKFCETPQGPYFKSYLAAMPRAFRTNLSHGKDAREGGDILYGIPTSVAESSESKFSTKVGSNYKKSFSSECRVWRINDNAGKLFEGGLVTTRGYRDRNGQLTGGPVLDSQWISSDYIADVTKEQPQVQQIAIAAGKTTDVLRFRPLSIPPV
jgi:hypothetical protein